MAERMGWRCGLRSGLIKRVTVASLLNRVGMWGRKRGALQSEMNRCSSSRSAGSGKVEEKGGGDAARVRTVLEVLEAFILDLELEGVEEELGVVLLAGGEGMRVGSM